MDILDLRDIASEYADAVEDGSDVSAYAELCDDLGISENPDALESYASDYGPEMIAEFDFEEYAKELAIDVGAVSGHEDWPLNCIDWQVAADNLAEDYSEVTYGGISYLIRTF